MPARQGHVHGVGDFASVDWASHFDLGHVGVRVRAVRVQMVIYRNSAFTDSDPFNAKTVQKHHQDHEGGFPLPPLALIC